MNSLVESSSAIVLALSRVEASTAVASAHLRALDEQHKDDDSKFATTYLHRAGRLEAEVHSLVADCLDEIGAAETDPRTIAKKTDTIRRKAGEIRGLLERRLEPIQ